MEKGLPDKRHGCRGMGKVHQDLDGSSLLKETPMIKKQMSETSVQGVQKQINLRPSRDLHQTYKDLLTQKDKMQLLMT